MIRGILFDFDGTLTHPAALDFPLMRRSIGCPDEMDILGFIDSLETADARRDAMDKINRIELDAATVSDPMPGAEKLIADCRKRGLTLGILTRNSHDAVHVALANFAGVDVDDFAVIVSRDSDAAAKPKPDGVLLAAREMKVPPSDLVMIGDFTYDIEAGEAAGATTVFMQNGDPGYTFKTPPSYTIHHLDELLKLPCFR